MRAITAQQSSELNDGRLCDPTRCVNRCAFSDHHCSHIDPLVVSAQHREANNQKISGGCDAANFSQCMKKTLFDSLKRNREQRMRSKHAGE